MATRAEVIAILERLRCSYHPVPEIAADTVGIYAELLSDFPADVLAEAAIRIVKASKWFPSIAELRDESARCVSYRNAIVPPDPEIFARHQAGEAERIARAKAWREEKPPEGLSPLQRERWIEKWKKRKP